MDDARMTFQQAIITCFRKYFTLSGRASRSEYWWFVLFNFLGGLIASATETFINNVSGTPGGQPSTIQPIALPWLSPNDVTTKDFPILLPDIWPALD